MEAPGHFTIGDVNAEMDGLAHGAGVILFVSDGRLEMLEGFTYAEPWPNEIGGFRLTYMVEPRDLKIPAD